MYIYCAFSSEIQLFEKCYVILEVLVAAMTAL